MSLTSELRTMVKRAVPADTYLWMRDMRDTLTRPAVRRLRTAYRLRRNGVADGSTIPFRDNVNFLAVPDAHDGIEQFCYRDLDAVSEMDSFIARAAGRNAFLDIGALHGVFSIVFTNINTGGTALCVEPSSLALKVLQENLELNKSGEAVTVVPVAVGHESGVLKMVENGHHFEVRSQAEAVAAEFEHEVQVTTVDLLTRSNGFMPDTMKVDVEGFELSVFRGAREMLTKCRPLIFLELHPSRCAELGLPAEEVMAELHDLGYVLYDRDDREYTLERLRADPHIPSIRVIVQHKDA